VGKDGNNDLADLFKAALDDEETRHASGNGRPPKAAAPGGNRTKPPAKVNSAAARAPTAALPSKPSVAPSDPAEPMIPAAVTRPTKPQLRAPSRSEMEGLVAIPRSEANTVGRVNAYEAKAPKPTSPSVSMPPRSVSRDADATQQTLPPQGAAPKPTPANKTPSATMPPLAKSTGTMSLPPSGRKGTNASEIRGRPANELTLPPGGGDASEQLDHKGRSRPIYAPRTPRPSQKRVKPGLDVLLGLFPGARLMAEEKVGGGLAYALIGLLSLLPAVVVTISWSARAQAVNKLHMDPGWLVLHGAAAVLSVLLYELVRSASSQNVDRGRVRLSRWLAALFLPSLAVVLLGPGLVGFAPGPVEAAWLVAIPLAAISIVAAVDAIRARTELDAGRRSTGLTALFLGLSLVGGLLTLALSVELNASLAKRAENAGFVKLPLIVRAVRISV